MPKNSILVIGLMSGTSLDGIDAALVEIAGSGLQTRARLRHFISSPFDSRVQHELLQVASGDRVPALVISQLNFLVGTLYVEAIFKLCKEAGVDISKIDLIGSHGQTIFHQSEPTSFCHRSVSSTLQIGEGSIIAEQTGVTTVCDFRPRDMAAGGKGAPLIPYVDYLLFRNPRSGRILLNIGGIANVTVLPAGGTLNGIMAFDTGPGNMLIDAVVRRTTDNRMTFDRGGEMARRGRSVPRIIRKLLQHPYFRLSPPKTAGREQFGIRFLEDILRTAHFPGSEDLICTVTEFTALTVAEAIKRFVLPKDAISQLIVSGGGAENVYLMQCLVRELSQMTVLRSDDFGIPSCAKEAIGFAILANETLHIHPGNVPTATGARQATILGKVIYGKNYSRMRRRLMR